MEIENQEVKENKKISFKQYGVVVGFLCLEVLAFISFYLGHSYLLFGILSLVLAVLLGIVTFRQIKKDGITTYLFFLFPIFIFGILTALNGFNYNSIGHISIADSIFVPIGLLCISISGFFCSYLEKFQIKNALIVIYSALGIFVFINLFITMIYYVPFYTIIYRNSYIFYDGSPSSVPIGSTAYMLFGFSVQEVSLQYWSLFPSLLFTTVIPLFFLKYKENKTEFLIYLGLSVLSFICLLFTISKTTLISDIILIIGISIIVIAGKIKKSRSILNAMFVTLGIIFLLLLIILFLNAQTSWSFLSGLQNAISGNSLLNRLFNSNRYASKIHVIFQDLFSSFKLFGCPVGGSFLDYPNLVAQELSDIWLFDNLMSSGLFGALFFLAGLVIGIRRLFKYISKDNDKDYIKYLIVGYILGFLVIACLLYDNYPLINSDKMVPFFTSAPLMIVLFLLSYAFNRTLLNNNDKDIEINKDNLEIKENQEEQYDEISS